NVPLALTVSSAPDGSVNCVPSVPGPPADTAVTKNNRLSGSLSAPEPLSANRSPGAITLFSGVGTASFRATAGSSTAVMRVSVDPGAALYLLPSDKPHLSVRVGLAPKLVGLSLVDENSTACRKAW